MPRRISSGGAFAHKAVQHVPEIPGAGTRRQGDAIRKWIGNVRRAFRQLSASSPDASYVTLNTGWQAPGGVCPAESPAHHPVGQSFHRWRGEWTHLQRRSIRERDGRCSTRSQTQYSGRERRQYNQPPSTGEPAHALIIGREQAAAFARHRLIPPTSAAPRAWQAEEKVRRRPKASSENSGEFTRQAPAEPGIRDSRVCGRGRSRCWK